MELFSDAGSIPAISTIDNGVGHHQDATTPLSFDRPVEMVEIEGECVKD